MLINLSSCSLDLGKGYNQDDIHNVTVTINGTNIKQVNECKHLGVVIDNTLSWNQQNWSSAQEIS